MGMGGGASRLDRNPARVGWGAHGATDSAGNGVGSIYRVDIADGREAVRQRRDRSGRRGRGERRHLLDHYGRANKGPQRSGRRPRFFGPQRRRSPVWLDGTGARDVIPTGVITTGKQLTSDGAGTLYWGDREGCRVSRVRIDETSLTDLVVNIRDNSWLQECVGVAVDTPAATCTGRRRARRTAGRAGSSAPAWRSNAVRQIPAECRERTTGSSRCHRGFAKYAKALIACVIHADHEDFQVSVRVHGDPCCWGGSHTRSSLLDRHHEICHSGAGCSPRAPWSWSTTADTPRRMVPMPTSGHLLGCLQLSPVSLWSVLPVSSLLGLWFGPG